MQDLSYTAEFMDEGLRISASNKQILPADDQQPWVRHVSVTEPVQTT